MSQDLEHHILTLRQALLDGNSTEAETAKNWLMGEAAAALLHQDATGMNALRAHLADLAPLADKYGDGRPGDRWRAVWELLHACGETVRPLEQARLARPSQLSGLILRHIRDDEGITPSELGARVNKKPNHVSNTLRILAEQGLLYRVPQGKKNRYYLSEMGREILQRQQPVQPAPAPAPVPDLPHVDENRLQGRNIYELPGRSALRRKSG